MQVTDSIHIGLNSHLIRYAVEGLEGEAAGGLVAQSVTSAPALSSPHPALPCSHGSPSWIMAGCPIRSSYHTLQKQEGKAWSTV